MDMKTLASREVQTRFGAVLDAAKREPVLVTQYGRPAVVMMSVDEALAGQKALAGQRMSDFLRRLERVEATEQMSEQEIATLVDALR